MPFGGRRRVQILSGVTIVATVALVASVAAPAWAGLPTAPSVTGLTGLRPSATRLTFPISDQITASVDVGTGNLNVAADELNLPGLSSTEPIGASYNSRDTTAGSGATPTINADSWTYNFDDAGSLSQQASGNIVYTAADGSTWLFTLGTGGVFTAPSGLNAVLTGNQSLGYQLLFNQSYSTVNFDTNGAPMSVVDRNGNQTTVAFGGSSPAMTSPVGTAGAQTATLTYSGTTLTAKQTATGGTSRQVQFVKNSSSQLTSIVDADSNTTSFTYTSGLLTKIVSVTGAETDFTYDSSDRVTEVDQKNTTAGSPGTSTTRFDYVSGTQTLVATPDTSTGTSVPSGPHITYTIESPYLVQGVEDQMSRTRSSSVAYNSANQELQSLTTPSGTATNTYGSTTYPSLTQSTAFTGAKQTFTYGNTNPNDLYQPSSSTDSASRSTTYGYYGAGNLESTTSGTGSGTVTATATLGYNTNGTIATATAPNNVSPANPTHYSYTALQLTGITPPTGTSLGSRALTYDAFGRLHTITDGNSHTTTYTYDNDDRMLTTSYSDGTHTVTNTYDKAGKLLTSVSASGTITNTYDQLERQLTTVNTVGGGTETYTYDKAGNLLTTTDGGGTTTNTYDASGLVTQTAYPASGSTQYLNYGYDSQGRQNDEWLQSNHTGGNTVWAAHVHTSYDASGRVSEVIGQTGPNSTSYTTVFDTVYCYNTASAAPTCATAAATDQSQLQWSYDKTTGQPNSGQVTTYQYDKAGHIMTVAQSGGAGTNSTFNYTYDPDGNRLTAVVTGSNPSSQTLTYNAANQITSTGYSYDGAGNLTASPAATGSGTAAYTYNGAEQMTQSVVAGVTTNYTYAGGSQSSVLSEASSSRTIDIVYGLTDPQGNPEIEQYNVNTNQAYLTSNPGNGSPMMLTTSSGTNCLLVDDGLDNPVALLTDSSSRAFIADYDPWGVQTFAYNSGGNGAAQTPYVFHQGIKDPDSGLIKFGARWYDPLTGTWTQQDATDEPLDPANANRYAYAGDDPINQQDPGGQDVDGGDVLSACVNDALFTTAAAVVTGVAETGVGALGAAAVGCATGAATNYLDQEYGGGNDGAALDTVFYLGYIADALT